MSELWFRKVNVFGHFGYSTPTNRKGRVYVALGAASFVGWNAAASLTGVYRTHPLIFFGGWALFGAVYGLIGAAHTDWNTLPATSAANDDREH